MDYVTLQYLIVASTIVLGKKQKILFLLNKW